MIFSVSASRLLERKHGHHPAKPRILAVRRFYILRARNDESDMEKIVSRSQSLTGNENEQSESDSSFRARSIQAAGKITC